MRPTSVGPVVQYVFHKMSIAHQSVTKQQQIQSIRRAEIGLTTAPQYFAYHFVRYWWTLNQLRQPLFKKSNLPTKFDEHYSFYDCQSRAYYMTSNSYQRKTNHFAKILLSNSHCIVEVQQVIIAENGRKAKE